MGEIVKSKRNIIQEVSTGILFVVLWFGVVFYMLKISTMEFETPRQVYLHKSLFLLLIILVIVRKIKLYYIPMSIFAVLSTLAALSFLHRHNSEWGEIYRDVLLFKYFIIILFAMIMFDVIQTHKYVHFKDLNIVPILCILVSLFVISLVEFENIFILAITFLTVYLTPINSQEWKRQLGCLSFGGYLAFIVIFVQSFVVSPDNYVANRYVGTFTFPVAAGMATSTGLICAIYIFALQLNYHKRKIAVILSALLIIPPVIMEMVIMNRASILGLLFLLALSFIFLFGNQKKRSAIIKGIAVIVVFFAMIMIGLITMKTISNMDVDLNSIHGIARKPMGYVIGVSQYMFKAGSRYSMFKEGSILNVLDNFSSSRLTLWVQGLKTASFLPADDLGVVYPNGAYMPHVHSEYICLIRKYGYLGGVPIICAHFCLLAVSVKDLKKDKMRYLMTFMWMSYSMGLLSVEYAPWNLMPYCLIYVLLYPLVKKEEIY